MLFKILLFQNVDILSTNIFDKNREAYLFNNFMLFLNNTRTKIVETSLFSNRIKELKNEENIIISIPLSPYRCPPGPYERASLLAAYIKKKKFKSKVLVLDANQNINLGYHGNVILRPWGNM